MLSIDEENGAVSAYALPEPVSAENLDAVKTEVTSYFQQRFEDMDGVLREGPEEITVAGLPALRSSGDAVHNGMPTENTVVQAFDGTTEYFINCEYTRAQAAEIRQGCAQILNTLALERASEHEATRA